MMKMFILAEQRFDATIPKTRAKNDITAMMPS